MSDTRSTGTGTQVRTVLLRLRAVERWVEEATSVHMRPYILKETFEKDAAALRHAASGHDVLLARIEVRLIRLRRRLQDQAPR